MDINHFILIRGLTRSSEHWGEFPSFLEEKWENSKIHYIELPGSGNRFKDEFPLSNTILLSYIYDEISKIKKNHQGYFTIVSISLGGIITLKLLEKYPTIVNSSFIINSSARNLSSFYERLRPKNYLKLLKAVISNIEQREEIVFSMTNNDLTNKTQIVQNWINIQKKFPITLWCFLKQLIWAGKTSAPRMNIDNVYFICSEHDQLVSYKCSIALNNFYNSKLFINNHAGHDLPSDDPDWLIRTIQKVLT